MDSLWFIVGKDQKIEWIGHPMEMDDPLEQVVKGKWNREVFAKEFAESQKADIVMSKLGKFMRNQDFEGAIKLIDESLVDAKPSDSMGRLAMLKMQILMQSKADVAALKAALMDAMKLSDDSMQALFVLAFMSTEIQRTTDLKSPDVFTSILGKLEAKVKNLSAAEEQMKPFVSYMIGRLQIASGQKEKGLASLKKPSKKYRLK